MLESSVAPLAQRHRRPELMDQPGLDANEHARALTGLGRINRASRSAAILWPALFQLARSDTVARLRVLDLGTGGGDVPIALAGRAARDRLPIHFDGCDKSALAVRFATENAISKGRAVRFFTFDAMTDSIPNDYDVLMCSLFMHHFDDADATGLLRRMAGAAGRMVLVNDLIRCRVGYALAWAGCRLLSRSPIVHHDGPASVASAFTLKEVRELARRADLGEIALARRWPFRFLMAWSR
jgi:SAM-dependent methyltransferase